MVLFCNPTWDYRALEMGVVVTAIFLMCFGTLNYTALPDAEFFSGARCVLAYLDCVRAIGIGNEIYCHDYARARL